MSWVAAAVAVGAAVFSYIGSKGNPTGALLLANFKGLQALHENITAINQSLQFLTQYTALMYEKLNQKIDLLNLNEYLELQHANLETATGEIAAYQKTIELGFGQSVSLAEHHALVGSRFDQAGVFRSALLASSKDKNFVGTMIACYVYRLESEILNYLIDRGQKIKNKKYHVGQIVQICTQYREFLLLAIDKGVKGSIAQSLQADQDARDKLLKDFGPASARPLPLRGGRYFCGNSKLVDKYYPTKFADIPVPPGKPKIVEYPAHHYASYNAYFLVVDEAVLGSVETPVSQLKYGSEIVPRGKEYYEPHEIKPFNEAYEDSNKNVELKGFEADQVYDDLLDRIHQYNTQFADRYFDLSARINNWAMILEAARLTLEDIACILQLIEKKDSSCLEGAKEDLESQHA